MSDLQVVINDLKTQNTGLISDRRIAIDALKEAQAEIKRLEEENDHKIYTCDCCRQPTLTVMNVSGDLVCHKCVADEFAVQITSLKEESAKENQRLTETLKLYGKHKMPCSYVSNTSSFPIEPDDHCDCGFQQALKGGE